MYVFFRTLMISLLTGTRLIIFLPISFLTPRLNITRSDLDNLSVG